MTTRDAIDLLNEMHRIDPVTTAALLAYRIPCNDAVAQHPTIQVGGSADRPVVGFLGVLNGILESGGEARVCSCHDDATDDLTGFGIYQPSEGDGG